MIKPKDSLVFSTRLDFRHRSIFVFDDIIWRAAYYDSNPAVYDYVYNNIDNIIKSYDT